MAGEGEFRSDPQTADRQGATVVLDLDAVEDRERINAQDADRQWRWRLSVARMRPAGAVPTGKTGRRLNEISNERRLASVAVRTGDGRLCRERA
jgi:hypothetical protein